MKDKKKILGILGLTVSAVISTVVTNWMTEKEIKKQVDEAITERSKDGES